MNLLPIIFTMLAMSALAAVLAVIPSLRAASRRSLRRGAFAAVIAVLGISALGLNATVSFLQIHFKKRPLPLAVRSLTDSTEGIPVQLGEWIAVSPDAAIDPEIQQVLGTAQYLFRDYADARRWPTEQLLALRDRPKDERDAAVGEMQAQSPESILRVAITYYTGLADTVAHIPERCYVADGFDVSAYETHEAICGMYADGSPRKISYRLISFEDQTARGRVGRVVGYLFHVDGVYESDSLVVRNRLASLRERYGYYAKVELMTTDSPGHDEQRGLSQAAMTDFLTAALPELEKKLPDWKRVHEQGSGPSSSRPGVN
jgi:Protein of unknown function (DUF3485)